MLRGLSAAIGSVLVAVMASLAGPAGAQGWLERSGNTFHMATCPGPAARGMARCHAHVVTDGRGSPIARMLARNITPAGYGPSALWAAYNKGAVPTGGVGITVAIVDAYGYTNAASDLATYRSQYGLPACLASTGCFRKVNQNGGTSGLPRQNTGWAQESALDIEMVSAMCPNCKIILVEANSASFADLATAEQTAARMGAAVISNSYGGGESGSAGYAGAYNYQSAYPFAVNPNLVITASSGDSAYAAGPQFPASLPSVIAVGGTSLASNGTQTAWSGAGSGCSTTYPKPTWQFDSGCAMRTIADVSAVADPNTGVAVFGPANSRTSAWLVFGGTSVAAPLIAGVYGNVVNSSQFPYGRFLYGNSSALTDVTSGSNGSCGAVGSSTYYLCNAVGGYDGPTGLGTPNGFAPF